jgi:hypothetical protein
MDMRTKKGIASGVLATAIVAAVPAAAQAHHVAGGSAQCTLIGNVPTITASARFERFSDYNKPISGHLDVDSARVETVTGFTFSGPTGTWNSARHTVKAGRHHVHGEFTWPRQNGENGSFDADVNCPAPQTTTPPPSPSPSPPPSSSPSPPPAGSPPPAAATPPAAAAPAPPAPQGGVLGDTESHQCVAKKLPKYHVTVTPKHQMHGLVTFHLRGPGASHVRWYIDTHRAGLSGQKWEWLRRGGRDYSVYLWVQARWGQHLWGRHTIEARFRVKDSCGKARAVRVQRVYFNHDPLPNDPIFAH